MTAKQALLYSRDKFKTVSDAWSHAIHLISYPCYNPKDYKVKSFSEEMEELFLHYVAYGFLYLNEKENWTFKILSIEEALGIINQ